MKYIFLSFLFFTLSFRFAVAQSFTLTELVNMTKMNVDEFDTYVLKKGYRFMEVKASEDSEWVTYTLNQSLSSKKAEKFITIYTKFFEEKVKNVTFQTNESSDYLNIKSQIKQLGFVFTKTKIYNKATFICYEKGKLELVLVSSQLESKYGIIYTGYEINLTNSKKE